MAFLGETPPANGTAGSPLGAAAVVGLSYLIGTLVPVLPVAFGATTMVPTVLAAGATLIAVSALLAFLSGMELRRRLAINLAVMAAAVCVTYAAGAVTKRLFGVAVQ